MKIRTIWGILFVCIIIVTGGCSSDEMEQSNQVSFESSKTPDNQTSLESSGINGQWSGVMEGSDGKDFEMNFRFKAEGNTLVGLLETRFGSGPISDGKIEGDNIMFKHVAALSLEYNGTLMGDEIHLTETRGERKTNFILRRVR